MSRIYRIVATATLLLLVLQNVENSSFELLEKIHLLLVL